MKRIFFCGFLALLTMLSGISLASKQGSNSEAQGIFGPEGGILEVTDSNSPLYGVKLIIPKGALKSETPVSISIVSSGPELPEGRCWDRAGNKIIIPKPNPITKIISISSNGLLSQSKLIIPFDGTKVKDKNLLFAFGYNSYSLKSPVSPWDLMTVDQSDIGHNILNVYLFGGDYNIQLVVDRKHDECYTSHAGSD